MTCDNCGMPVHHYGVSSTKPEDVGKIGLIHANGEYFCNRPDGSRTVAECKGK